MHLHEQPVPPSAKLGAPLPADLEALLLRCLAKKPDERPASALDFWNELRSCCDAHTWDVFKAGKWWEQNRQKIETAREQWRREKALRQKTQAGGVVPPTPTVAVPRRKVKG